jgi:hypothetical protein
MAAPRAFAVKTAPGWRSAPWRVCDHLSTLAHPSRLKRWAEDQLPLELTRGWQARVEQRLQRSPVHADRTGRTRRRRLDAQLERIRTGLRLNPAGRVMAPSFILYLQLGDGDILVVNADGEVERPFPRDPRLIANETTSLCSPQAWNDVQVRFQTLAGAPPALILAATDGYANAFRDESGFQQAARDYWTLLRDGGEPAVQPHLTEWLNEASRLGSGDDVSLGLIWRPAHSKTRLV